MVLGLLISLSGFLCLYLASPNQLWLNKPWGLRAALLIGLILICSGLYLLAQPLSLLAAIFTLLHWVMLLAVLSPYLGALLRNRKKTV